MLSSCFLFLVQLLPQTVVHSLSGCAAGSSSSWRQSFLTCCSVQDNILKGKMGDPVTFDLPPLKTLPDEIWETILINYVSSLKDLYTCYNVSPHWAEIILRRVDKATLLLPQVIPVLRENLKFDDAQRLGTLKNGHTGYLENGDWWRCRFVSRKWREAVDTTLSPLWNDFFYDYYPWQFIGGGGTQLHTVKDVTRFLETMENYEDNPFPARSLIYHSNLEEPSSADEFYRCLPLLGKAFGSQVWRLAYLVNNNFIGVHQIHTVFEHFPNLRKLDLVVCFSHEVVDEDEFCQEPIPSHPLMLHLEEVTISLRGSSKLSRWILGLCRNAPNLERLTFKIHAHHHVPLSSPLFPKLPPVAAILPLHPDETSPSEDLPLQPTPNDWPLKKLKVSYSTGFSKVKWYGERGTDDPLLICLHHLLNTFYPTLEQLVFDICTLRCGGCSCHNRGIRKMVRRCKCNKGFNSLDNGMPFTGVVYPSNTLKVLSLSHFFLHPLIFSGIMEKAPALRELRVNDMTRRNFKTSGHLPDAGHQVDNIILQIWDECSPTMKVVSVDRRGLWEVDFEYTKVLVEEKRKKKEGSKGKKQGLFCLPWGNI